MFTHEASWAALSRWVQEASCQNEVWGSHSKGSPAPRKPFRVAPNWSEGLGLPASSQWTALGAGIPGARRPFSQGASPGCLQVVASSHHPPQLGEGCVCPDGPRVQSQLWQTVQCSYAGKRHAKHPRLSSRAREQRKGCASLTTRWSTRAENGEKKLRILNSHLQ